jgi:hypothetical protein
MRSYPSPARLAAVAVVAAAALAHLSCGSSSPSTSTPPTTIAKPTPTPPPASSVGDTFNDAACALGKGTYDTACDRTSSRLLGEYEKAIDLLVAQKPGIFDLHDEAYANTGSYRVLDKDAYMDGVVMNLRAAHLCAERDPDDGAQETIRLKNSNDFSEAYDVILSSGHIRRGEGAYRLTCSPAAFPVDREQDAPPIGSGCGRPYPPPVTRLDCKIHIKSPEYYTLDSTPLVGPDQAYCDSVGFVGRSICPVRPEGTPDREACENWRVGKAKDTGRGGPTWTKGDGSYCTGPESGCQNHPDTQYSLWTYVSGTYVVTAENGASCTVTY